MKELLLFERDILGLCFSGKVLDSYEKHLAVLKPVEISSIINDEGIREKSNVSVAGLITSRTVKKTKNDETMAFIKLSDSYGEIELIVFPKSYDKYGDLLYNDNVVFVNGTINLKEDEPPKIILSSATQVLQDSEFNKAEEKRESKLYLKVASVNSSTVNDIISLLKEYDGDTEVILFETVTKKYVKASGVKISVNDSIISALKMILGPDSVVYKV